MSGSKRSREKIDETRTKYDIFSNDPKTKRTYIYTASIFSNILGTYKYSIRRPPISKQLLECNAGHVLGYYLLCIVDEVVTQGLTQIKNTLPNTGEKLHWIFRRGRATNTTENGAGSPFWGKIMYFPPVLSP